MNKKLVGLFVLLCVLIGANKKYNLFSMSESESDQQKVKEYYERLKAAQEDPKAQEKLRKFLEKTAPDWVRRSVKQPGRCPLKKEFIDFLLGGGPVTLLRIEEDRPIRPITFSPDGSKVAKGLRDNTAKLWDVNTDQLLHTFAGHTDTVYSVAFSPDGSKLATGSGDNRAKLWNVNTGDLLHTLAGHTNAIWSVTFSPDGSKLATGSGDNSAKLWDVNTGDRLHTLAGHADQVSSVVFSSDGSKLATGSHDKTTKLWDVNTGQLLHTLAGHTDTVFSVAFSPDGNRLITKSRDETTKLWDMQRLNEITRLRKEEIKEKEIREKGKNLTKEPTISLQRFLKVLPDNECEQDPEYCNIMSIEQCELLQAFENTFKNDLTRRLDLERIQPTQEQWKIFKSLPQILQEILKICIKERRVTTRKHKRRKLHHELSEIEIQEDN